MKKRLLLVLSAMTVLASCGTEKPSTSVTPSETVSETVSTPELEVKGQAIIGSSTELSGDFIWPGLGGSSAGAADQDISRLTGGYATMELNRGGSYVWNNTVVKSHTEEEIDNGDDGATYRVTIEINPGLKFSDGKEVKAANYLAYTLAMSSPVSDAAFGYNRSGYSLVGWDTFHKYDGTNAAEEGVSKYFSGLRLLSDYKFSLEVNQDNYPYYYAYTFGAVSPESIERVIGTAEVKDDGQGAYLTDAFYAKTGDVYNMVSHLTDARFNYTKYGYSGAYTIQSYDTATKVATLKVNPNYVGNWEGQKPHVETVIYKHIVTETQMEQLKSGEIDVISGLTGGDEVNAGLALVNAGGFKEVHYDRAGYGKVEFECDFGPTQFAEVRQAVAYCLDRQDFANTFCTGYGSVVNGPYSVNFDAYQETEEYLDDTLNTYAYNVNNAKKVLRDAGWVYNADGTAYDETAANPGVRYKKLSADEYGVDEVNKTYKSLNNEDGIEYKTEKVGDDYYLPLAINWFATEDNPVSELLVAKLMKGTALTQCGIVLRQNVGSFTALLGEIYREAEYGYGGTPQYGMLNLATGWNSSVYDYSYNWIGKDSDLYDDFFEYSSNKLSDPYDAAFQWDNPENQGLTYEAALAKADGKLGMNYISFAMVYSVKPGDTAEFNKWFDAYMVRWNELLPDIPLYCNVYYDIYNAKLENFSTSPFFGAAQAILYANVK